MSSATRRRSTWRCALRRVARQRAASLDMAPPLIAEQLNATTLFYNFITSRRRAWRRSAASRAATPCLARQRFAGLRITAQRNERSFKFTVAPQCDSCWRIAAQRPAPRDNAGLSASARLNATFMISQDHIITTSVTPSEMAYLQRCAQRAEIGGRSNIRGRADRAATLQRDQLVGMVGGFVGAKIIFGDVRLFRLQRFFADLYPNVGDGGSDIPGGNVDFKSSLVTNPNLLSYRLAVRERERHAGTVYVLILIALEPSPVANLVGWASDEMLPAKPETEGPFAGAYVIPASALHPIMPLRWFDEARPPTKQRAGPLEVNAIDIKW